MFRAPQMRTASELEIDRELLGEEDLGEECEPMLDALEVREMALAPEEDYEDVGSIRTSSQMTELSETSSRPTRNYFERIPSPNLDDLPNTNFTIRPGPGSYNYQRRPAYRSNNTIDGRRDALPQNQQLPRSTSFNNQQRSSSRQSSNGHQPQQQQYRQQQQHHQQQSDFPPPHQSQENFCPPDYSSNNEQQQFGFPQNWHSQPRNYNNNFNGNYYNNGFPRRGRGNYNKGGPTYNYNFISLPPFQHHYGYPQQIAQTVADAQRIVDSARLYTAHSHDYNSVRPPPARITVTPREEEDEIQCVYSGPARNSARKRKSTSSSSVSSGSSSSGSITIQSSNRTLTSEIPSKRSNGGGNLGVFNQFSSVPNVSDPFLISSRCNSAIGIPYLHRPGAETPVSQMLGLKITEVEEGEIVDDAHHIQSSEDQEIYCLSPASLSQSSVSIPQSIPSPQAAPQAEKAAESVQQQQAAPESLQSGIYKPGDSSYDPLLDDEKILAECDAMELPDDAEELLMDEEEIAERNEELVFKKFPNLQIKENP